MIVGLIFSLFNLIYGVACTPSVHPGSLIVSGVTTCGHGAGYCLRGDDCTADARFVPDSRGGHCDALLNTSPPSTVHYSCCRRDAKKSTLEELRHVVTAALNATEISDSIDVLNRANDVVVVAADDINDVSADRTEDGVFDTTTTATTAANEQAGEQTSDINDLCCPPQTTNVDDADDHQRTPVATIDSRSASTTDDDIAAADSSSSAHELLKIHRALFGERITKNERNCTVHDQASLFALPSAASTAAAAANVSPQLRGTAIKEKFDKNKCLNLTSQFEGADEGCVNIWKFVSRDKLLCVGTLINSVWLLTSAACVTKMFNEGVQIDTIVATDIEEKSGYYGISNMIVHENYMIEGISDMHDVGLVSLNQIVNVSCFGCLPVEERKYADKSCTTYMMSGNRKSREYLGKCQDRLKILNMNSKMYLSLPCSTDEEHPFATESHSANALWCENKLVGIETSYDQGYFVFTPINDYVEWITHNVQLYL